MEKIMLFDQEGSFIRQIGSKGNGPGEFAAPMDIATDTQHGYLYILSTNKLICYQLDGNFIKEIPVSAGRYLNYLNNELLLIAEFAMVPDGEHKFNRSVVYKINDNLQVIDSIDIRKVSDPKMVWTHPWRDFITRYEKNAHLYYYEFNPEPFLRDTLFQIKNDRFIPHLKLNFQNHGFESNGEKTIYISNIYKSSRFVFSVYMKRNEVYHFCYDTKTNKGYNMKEGYTDDIYQLPKRVDIRPFNDDTEMFYYLYTHINDIDNKEEPNPTLYIGKLKK
jgi:hypothetical protein